MNSDLPEQSNNEPDTRFQKVEAICRRMVRLRRLGTFCFSVTVAGGGSLIFLHPFRHNPVLRYYFTLPVSAIFLLLAFVSNYSWRAYNRAAKSLNNLADVQHIGPLLDAFTLHPSSNYEYLRPLLLHLLPQVQASHASLFTLSRRRKLYALLAGTTTRLSKYYSKELSLAILKALEQVGDKEAYFPVQRVVTGNKDVEVRAAAEECLLFLRQRMEQQNATDTLLRPSNPANAAPDTLLRASVARQETQPELLLRANTAPDEHNV